MIKPVDIALLAFDGIQILDVTGPAAVFAAANNALGKTFYRVHILSAKGGPVQSNSAVQLHTSALQALPPHLVDTLLIAGGDEEGLRALAGNVSVRTWVIKTAARTRRFGSVCSGAFILGHFGLINGKRVATHWEACARLAEYYPDILVDPEALYIQDGRVWTSAGVTTGIDMSLAMVEQDLGNGISNAIAERLVLYARRPGYQSQFSPILHAQAQAAAPFSKLVNWMSNHLTEPLDVPQLAAHAAMSERSFYRKFTESIGETPAHFVATLRLDHVRHLLKTGGTLKEIAAKTGFSSAAQLSKAFERRFGVTPLLFLTMHGAARTGVKSL